MIFPRLSEFIESVLRIEPRRKFGTSSPNAEIEKEKRRARELGEEAESLRDEARSIEWKKEECEARIAKLEIARRGAFADGDLYAPPFPLALLDDGLTYAETEFLLRVLDQRGCDIEESKRLREIMANHIGFENRTGASPAAA